VKRRSETNFKLKKEKIMQDLWEIIGRLITTQPLRDAVFNNPDMAAKNTTVTGGIQILSTKYATLTNLLGTSVTNRPVSMFSIGELARVLPFRSFEQSITRLAGIVPAGSDLRSATFQTALGLLAIDSQYRDQFRGFPDLATANIDFPAMTLQELTDLQALITQSTKPFCLAATGMCDEDWEPICFGILVPYASQTQLHPVLALP
jgi:hypothetical protein